MVHVVAHGPLLCLALLLTPILQWAVLLVYAQTLAPKCQVVLQAKTITTRLNFTHTNYGFCKNLTEHMLAGYHNNPFPVCINRPVSVGCVAKGPCAGYVGNTSGTTGIILSVGCGKSLYSSEHLAVEQAAVSLTVTDVAAVLAGCVLLLVS